MSPAPKHLALAFAASALVAWASPVDAAMAKSRAPKVGPTTCFWGGPATDRQNNFAYPDAGAAYWAAEYSLPAGAKLMVKGDFPHARFMSFTAYRSNATPSEALNDFDIDADLGDVNPFVAGARRDGPDRGYTVDFVPQAPPANESLRRGNTLYTSAGTTRQTVMLRVYVWDRGRDVTGGVGLPEPELLLADGSVLRGGALCAAVKAGGLPPDSSLSRKQYAKLRNQPGEPATFPALSPPRWDAAYNGRYDSGCVFEGECGGTPTRETGQYSNLANAYVSTYANRGHGKVLVIRGKLPRTPKTLKGTKVMGAGQLRYWSICQNEGLATTKVTDCLFDEQLKLDGKGYYTIVTSKTKDRPANAKTRCGITFLPWSRRGDGAGHPDDAYLIIRNMLPAATFEQAIQETKAPPDEMTVMGDYYPRSTYTSRKSFQRLGCRRKGSSP